MPNDEKVMITESHLTDIADAIREQNGQSDTYTPVQMASAIRALSPGTGLLAPDYDSLLFPISRGTHCMHDGKYYICTRTIPTAESFIIAHWEQVMVGDELEDLQGQQNTTEGNVTDLQTAVDKRVRWDAAQSLTNAQQKQARTNIGAAKVYLSGTTLFVEV